MNPVAITAVAGRQGAHAAEARLDRDIAVMQTILKQRPDAEIYYRLGDLYAQKGHQTAT